MDASPRAVRELQRVQACRRPAAEAEAAEAEVWRRAEVEMTRCGTALASAAFLFEI